MAKRFIAVFMVALMVVALVGCGSSSREIVQLTLSTEDSTAILAAAGIMLPDVEDAVGANTTIKYHHWSDAFHNYDEDEIINTGYWTFVNKYGGEVDWIETTYSTRFDDLANLVLSSQSPDFTTCSVSTYPYYCIKGIFVPVDDYIDYTDALWAGTADFAANYFSIGGQNYAIITDIKATTVIVYNRRVMEEWGYDDPAELYYNDQWTWDVFYEMCVDFTDPDEDRYALDGWYWEQAIIDSTGVTVIALQDGEFVSNIDDPRLEEAEALIYDLNKNDCIYPRWNNSYQCRDNTTIGAGIKEGLTLFYPVEKWGFTDTVENVSAVWGDITEGEVMFCPMPRDEDGDGNYYLAAQPVGYHIIQGAANPDAVVLLAACERFKVLDPTVIDIDTKQLKETYLWTDEMLEMLDETYELVNNYQIVNFTSGCQSALEGAVENLIGGTIGSSPSTWAQLKETYSERIEYYIDELNAMYRGEIEVE
ncbi:MAG: extracellular solute-binding protein [Oscillospiraceae bacterium]|nr:extracellular solute-binding protein [Oscillospiraceae bacterium]